MHHRRRLAVIFKQLFFLKRGTHTPPDLAPTSPRPHTWPLCLLKEDTVKLGQAMSLSLHQVPSAGRYVAGVPGFSIPSVQVTRPKPPEAV